MQAYTQYMGKHMPCIVIQPVLKDCRQRSPSQKVHGSLSSGYHVYNYGSLDMGLRQESWLILITTVRLTSTVISASEVVPDPLSTID